MRTRSILRTLLLAGSALVLGSIAGLTLVEVLLRTLHLAPTAGIVTVTERDFNRIPGLFSPSQAIVDRQNPQLPFSVHINRLGFRGADIPTDKAPDELRILAIGDSFTYGDFVDDDETLPAQLQNTLSALCGHPITIINAGIGGTSIDTHIQMARRGLSLSPDLVLLIFSENDVTDLRESTWERLAANRWAKSHFPLAIIYPMMRHMAVWHFALKMRATLLSHVVHRQADARSAPAAESEIGHLRAMYAGMLKVLHAEVRSGHSALVISAFPSHLTLSGSWSDEQLHWLEALAVDEGIPMIDLLGPLRAANESVESLYLLPHDGHASSHGNQVATSELATGLVKLGLCASDRP